MRLAATARETKLDAAQECGEDRRMSVSIDIEYLGGLRTNARHAPSTSTLLTDAPVDNHGKGEAFSPTDLCATALGTCMLTTMGIFAERQGIDFRGATVHVEKEMVSQPRRRIGCLRSELRLPLPADHPLRADFERIALTCPVFESLLPEIEKPVAFIWNDPGSVAVAPQ